MLPAHMAPHTFCCQVVNRPGGYLGAMSLFHHEELMPDLLVA